MPTGSVAAVLALLAATIGAVAVTITRAREVTVLMGLLTAGQVGGHLLLTAAGHGHTSPLTGGFGMLAAHVGAVVGGALLIAAADRLNAALSSSIRRVARPDGPLAVSRPTRAVQASDQPMRSMILLATSLSQRGPPVGVRA